MYSLLTAWSEWMDRLGLMAWPLLVCSVAALTIILERTVFYAATRLRRNTLWNTLSTPLIHHQHQSKVLRDEAIALALAELQRSHHRGLLLLRFIGTLSPLLGLLGTILGIIQMFRVVAAHSGSISPQVIAGGLWEALLSTAVGLMIAVPALVMAHIFQTLADGQLNHFCSRLNSLSLSFALPTKAGNVHGAAPDQQQNPP